MKVLPLSCIFAYTNLITHEFLYSSSSLLNESLLHDKLWGPSQRVVTLFCGAGGPRQAERPGRPELGLVDKRMGTKGVF